MGWTVSCKTIKANLAKYSVRGKSCQKWHFWQTSILLMWCIYLFGDSHAD